ncbi:MAG: phosphatidylserine decarboxylase family protein [candidate division Zixibacteria bacterium]|nr:phosphatidylserine decarboxylase family protein [candidate division Zixibacteria bacterium]NIR63850.1 phosphatidylserine decarboxylase family protein [candidate division Zixibacteria bacterium]NIS14969.1 phosphatidylserine decarboxylase family protein [candidate division Zixibacteria bacterium]NIS45806.1 phosphatidylserine decarboxylase family protein [candidate division Zixibacteria bacterium]NIT51495.1 phosphatidylserine decarboxylase family protein [candidate division Zixibacteria bacteri
MKIASEGLFFIYPGAVVFVILLILYIVLDLAVLIYPVVASAIFLGFTLFFFRDPERNAPDISRALLAPADGKIIALDNTIPGYLNGFNTRLSIFLSMLNVHVNRIPTSGIIQRLEYHPGQFKPAFTEKAAELNEHTIIEIDNKYGRIGLCQRAGTIARRIVCNLSKGQRVNRGERFGMIRFGSRVDVYMPENVRTFSRIGDRVKAGETVIGEFAIDES